MDDNERTTCIEYLPPSERTRFGTDGGDTKRARNRVVFTLPRSFDPLEFLTTPRLQMCADDTRWLISTIVRKTANRDTDARGCVHLHSQILARIMYEPTMRQVIAALEDGGAIDTAPAIPGYRSTGYRLGSRYLSDRHVLRRATDVRLIERIERERQRQKLDEQRTLWQPIHFALDADQQHVSIGRDADRILDHLPDHVRLCQDVLVGNIRRRDLPFTVSSTQRVFNAITGLKRDLRASLRIDGQPVGSVDIRCAQAAMLALLIAQEFPTNGLNKLLSYKHARCPRSPCSLPLPCPDADFLEFQELTSSGRLYEKLMALTGWSREVVKDRFIKDVLAKDGGYPSEVEQAFQSEFPSVYRIIKAINRDDHAALIRLLQRVEAWLVIETVSPRLVGRIPIVTLHDAIYSRRVDVDVVAEAFGSVFDELGFEMALKCE